MDCNPTMKLDIVLNKAVYTANPSRVLLGRGSKK